MVSSYWQKAWDDAQLQLSAPYTSPEPPSAPRQHALRVGQLDAELLDEELARALQEPLAKALAAIHPAFQVKFEPELALLIRLCLYKLSVWDLGATYGAKLQDLCYVYNNPGTRNLSPSGLPKGTLAVHVFLTVLIPYFHSRTRSHALSNLWPDLPLSDRRRWAWHLLNKLEVMHSASTLLNFVVFLWSGRYRTLSDRLMRMHLSPVRKLISRQVSYEFMNRQMVWHAFTEFLILALPVIRSRAFRRAYQVVSRAKSFKWMSLLHNPSKREEKQAIQPVKIGRFAQLPQDQCAICAENASFEILRTSDAGRETANFGASFNVVSSSFHLETPEMHIGETDSVVYPVGSAEEPPKYPITTPYVTSCGHAYCYFCISERLIRVVDEGEDDWECLRCCLRLRSCQNAHSSYDSESVHTSDSWTSDSDDMISFRSEPTSPDL